MGRYAVAITLILGLGLFSTAAAQEEKPKKQVVSKEIVGAVSGVSNSFIAVTYGRNPESGILSEMAFNVNKGVKIRNKKNLNEIGLEDMVRVLYNEVTEIKDGGAKSVSYVVKEIVFMRKSDRKPAPEEVDDAENNALAAQKD